MELDVITTPTVEEPPAHDRPFLWMPLETWQSHRLALVPVSPNLKAFVTKLSRGSHVDSLHNTFRFVQKAQVSLLGHMGAELAHGDRVRLACNGRTFDIQKIG